MTLRFNKTQSPLGLVNCTPFGLSYAVFNCPFWLFTANVPYVNFAQNLPCSNHLSLATVRV